MSQEKIGSHTFCFNPQSRGDDSLTLTTHLFTNGDPGSENMFFNQELELQTQLNTVKIFLTEGFMTPEKLRSLASELDQMIRRTNCGKNNSKSFR